MLLGKLLLPIVSEGLRIMPNWHGLRQEAKLVLIKNIALCHLKDQHKQKVVATFRAMSKVENEALQMEVISRELMEDKKED